MKRDLRARTTRHALNPHVRRRRRTRDAAAVVIERLAEDPGGAARCGLASTGAGSGVAPPGLARAARTAGTSTGAADVVRRIERSAGARTPSCAQSTPTSRPRPRAYAATAVEARQPDEIQVVAKLDNRS
jgi:hypothetical protein